jgi:tripartite motif-containing protein 71
MSAGLLFRKFLFVAGFVAALLAGSCLTSRDAARPPQAGGGPSAHPQPQFEYLGEWGTRGAGPADLSLAVALASDSPGLIYIADAGSGFLHKFTRDGHPLLAFDDPLLATPVAVAVDSDGGIYAADGRSGRIFVFDPTGERIREQRAAGAGRFRSPSALAVDTEGNLFVADAARGEVTEYNAQGRFLRVVARSGAGAGRVRSPTALAVGPQGSLFVADEGNARILKFSARGEFLASWGEPGPGQIATKNPVSLAASSRYLFCFDAAPPRLLVWNLEGAPFFAQDLAARIALSSGSADTRASIAVVPRDELLLLDPSSGRVLRFRLRY